MSCLVEDKTGGKAAKKNKKKKKTGPTVHQAEITQSQALMALCAGYYKVTCSFLFTSVIISFFLTLSR